MTSTSPPVARGTLAYKIGLMAALAATGAWAALAPPERSLGDGIRVVYLHVSATLAGLACLYGVGLLGAVVSLRPVAFLEDRLRSYWIAGLGAFGLGLALSLVSAAVSWGGIFWAEPRLRASLGVVAVGMMAWAAYWSFGSARTRHLVWTVSAAMVFLLLRTAPLYIHPDDPVQSTTPLGIRAAFGGMFVLFLAASFCLAELLRRTEEGRRPSSE